MVCPCQINQPKKYSNYRYHKHDHHKHDHHKHDHHKRDLDSCSSDSGWSSSSSDHKHHHKRHRKRYPKNKYHKRHHKYRHSYAPYRPYRPYGKEKLPTSFIKSYQKNHYCPAKASFVAQTSQRLVIQADKYIPFDLGMANQECLGGITVNNDGTVFTIQQTGTYFISFTGVMIPFDENNATIMITPVENQFEPLVRSRGIESSGQLLFNLTTQLPLSQGQQISIKLVSANNSSFNLRSHARLNLVAI